VATKSEGAAGDFPASAYAYVPDPDKPSTWKLRLKASPNGGYDVGIVGAAVAALGKGFRGNKVQIPAGALAAVRAKVRSAWVQLHPDETVPAVLADTGDRIRAAARRGR